MKRKTKVKIIAFILVLIAIVVATTMFVSKQIEQNEFYSNPENLRAMSYGTLTEQDAKIPDCDYVEFSAFFARDINNDKIAEKIKGTCKEIGEKDTLYAELKVLTKGYLENGKITLNAKNFTWTTSLVSDGIVEGDYIGKTDEITLKNKINSGSEKLFWGTIDSNLENDTNNYTQINSITLTGTHVIQNDDGTTTRTEINKTVKFTVDWYGTTTTEVNKYYYSNNNYTSYQNQKNDIETLVDEENVKVNFKVAVSEKSKKLLLQKQVVEVTIPKLNGFDAIDAKSIDENVVAKYDKNEKILTITREAVVDSNGKITSTVARSNINNIEITYPLEAYTSTNENSISLNIPIKAYNYGYNNKNTGFTNPHTSSANGIIALAYSNPSGDVWIVRSYIGERIYNGISRDDTYVVSKEAPTKIYNHNIYEDEKDEYTVEWQVSTGKRGDIVNGITLEEKKLDETTKAEKDGSDELLNTSSIYESMSDYIKTTGIYFSNASNFLGEDGFIELYNPELDSVIETFTSENWGKYTKSSPYKVNLNSIQIKTSKPENNQVFSVYQIKEIDDDILTTHYKEEQFKNLSYIYTYLKGTALMKENTEIAPIEEELTEKEEKVESEIYSTSFANYEMPYSIAKLNVSPTQITNQKTEDITFTISANSSNILQKKWVNGVFLIQLPENIINIMVSDVKSSNEKVKITSSTTYEENGKHYIKIATENDDETSFYITVKANITANPLEPTNVSNIQLYYFNENCDNYTSYLKDQFDIDNDGITDDLVGHDMVSISIIAPSGLLTTEYITNYNDDENSKVIAPNIADVEKSNGSRTAKINVSITNNYERTISDVVILGKIPFENNTYTLANESLNSKFTANIKGQITLPVELKDIAKVYYSTVENPTKDIKEENGWVLADKVSNWNEIKTYLICLNEYKLNKNKNYIFSYDVEIPADLPYNSASFSHHAVYFSLETEDGSKLPTQIEPNKVGVQIVSKYNIQLTKNKKAYNNILVAGATYSVTTEDVDGNPITKSATTNNNGVLQINGLYLERTYILKEIASTDDYVVSDEEIEFTTKLNESGEFKFNVTKGNFKDEPQITKDDKENNLVKLNIEDESRYSLIINKTDEKEEPLEGVRFTLKGKGKNTSVRTNEKGQVIIAGLYPEEEYQLQETRADGYYVDQEARKFTIKRDEKGELHIESTDDVLNNAKINETEEDSKVTVTVDITNEKIPTYNLQILKVEEASSEQTVESLKPLTDATFKFTSDDTGDILEYTTNTNGLIEIPNLLQYVPGKYITGKYTIQETKAPDGYSNKAEEIEFKVSKENNELKIDVSNVENLTTYRTTVIEGNTVKIIIQDKPLFRLTKVDSETGEKLANAKFIIWKLDESGSEVDYAKDVNGRYVGEQNENGDYIVITDENGVISLPLENGIYKAVEVGYPDGYLENDNFEIFKVDNGKDKDEGYDESQENVVKINYIEDLVDVAKEVNNGNSYEGYTIFLARSLYFDQESSYEDATSMENDLNGDSKIESIMTELTLGKGWTPIGTDSEHCFKGVFDGCECTIGNLYINSNDEYVGLFGYVNNTKMKNINVNGIILCNNANGKIGGIIGYANNCSIENCSSDVKINDDLEDFYKIYGGMSFAYYNKSDICGGIIGYLNGGTISNCLNKGNVNGGMIVGGLVGSAYESEILDCGNKGKVCAIGGYMNVGGIVAANSDNYYSSNNITIKRSYNSGNIYSYSGGACINYVGGILGNANGVVEDCYNTGNITIKGVFLYVGGIVGQSYIISIKNCYNTGDFNEKSYYIHSIFGGSNGSGMIKNYEINNSYYPETLENIYGGDSEYGECVDDSYMKTEEFFKKLNVNGVWALPKKGYPTILTGILANTSKSTELSIENTIKKFKITTDIEELNGVKGGNISGEDEKPYESVRIYKENTKPITIEPNDGYEISKITINGEEINYNSDENGNYTIMANYFKNMQEDKHIVVTFAKKGSSLTINKVDYDNNEEKLSDAKFKITKTDYEQPIKNGVRYNETYNTGNVIESKIGSKILGSMTTNGTYGFENSGSYYRSTNYQKDSSSSDAYIKVDLRGLTGKYAVIVNASISSESIDKGCAWLTKNTNSLGKYDSTNQFIYIGGDIPAKDYNSQIVDGDDIYYLHFKYYKDSSVSKGSDRFIIHSVKVISASYDTYFFEQKDGKLVSNNQAKANTTANSYIPIDLTNSCGTWNLTLNTTISSESGYDYGYATITTSTTAPAYDNKTGQFIYISGVQYEKNYTTTLQGGTKYYLHLGYTKDSTQNSNLDCFTINNINLSTEATTNGNGKITLPVLQGLYQVQEIKAPEGYVLNSESQSINVIYGQENTLTFKNRKKPTLTINKVDDKTKQGLQGSKFLVRPIGMDVTDSISRWNQYYFQNYDGIYIADNGSIAQSIPNTTANSYIYLQQISNKGNYYVEVDAEISSEKNNDYGYATISYSSPNTSESGDTVKEFMKISGEVERKIYRSDVFTYYQTYPYFVNLGYKKNESIDGGQDMFKIYNIKLYCKDDEYTVETDENGLIKLDLLPGTYEIIELEAPSGYSLNSDPITVEVGFDQENSVTIANKKQPKITVHHYLKGTTNKVAPDEIYSDEFGKSYATSPHVDLIGLHLQKDEEGNHVIPEKASGTYTDEAIEITYYYEPDPINLTIHHYIEGTETSISPDENIKTDATVTFDEAENYKVSSQGSYELQSNESYKKLLEDYELSRIETTIQESANIEDTLTYTDNSEITYYYTLKKHTITTKVQTHTENRTNKVTNQKESSVVKGGDITGEYKTKNAEDDVKFVEQVKQKKDSTKEITATPEAGYRVKQIKLISTSDDETSTETIIYDEENGEQNDENAEIKYEKNENGSITLKSVTDEEGVLFKNVTENKCIIVEFAPNLSKVVVHHYIEGTGEEFSTPAQRILSIDPDVEVADEIKEDFAGETYATQESPIKNKRYKCVSTSENTYGTFSGEDVIDVYYYYNLDSFAYTVHYYYDEEEKLENMIIGDKVLYGTVISDYESKPEGYVFDKVLPADENDETKANLEISENEDKNRIDVYYVSSYKITTKVVEHEEKYSDGHVENVKGGTISGQDEEIYEEVLWGRNSTRDIVIKPDEGYEIAKVTITEGSKTKELDIKSFVESDGSITLNAENDYFTNVKSNKHIEVEFRKKTKVIVKFLEKDTKAELKEEITIDGLENDVITKKRESIIKYRKAEIELENGEKASATYEKIVDEISKYTKYDEEIENRMFADPVTIIFWYEKIPKGTIIVRHIEINEEDIRNGLTLDSGIELKVEEKYIKDITSGNDDVEDISNEEGLDEISTEKDVLDEKIEGLENDNKATDKGKEESDKVDENTENKEESDKVNEKAENKEESDKVNEKAENKEESDKINEKTENKEESNKENETTEGKEKSNNKNEATPESDNTATTNDSTIENEEGSDEADTTNDITPEGQDESEKAGESDIENDLGNEASNETTNDMSESTTVEASTVDDTVNAESEEVLNKILKLKQTSETIESANEVKYNSAKVENIIVDNENGELTTEKYEGLVNTTQQTERRVFTDKLTGRKYISVDGPVSDKSNIIIVGKDYNNYLATILENDEDNDGEVDITEVRYYYTKQYQITTEVKTHKEVVNGIESDVKGGTISGEAEEFYENVNNKGSNKNIVEIAPDLGYRVKQITINDEEISLDSLQKSDRKILLGEGYFKEMCEDKHIVVEFERIPARIIIKYLDEETETEIATEDIINGFFDSDYETEGKQIEGYELIEEKLPNNAKGKMTEDDIIVKYYYRKIPKQDIVVADTPDIPAIPKENNVVKTYTGIQDVKTGDNIAQMLIILIASVGTLVVVIKLKYKNK